MSLTQEKLKQVLNYDPETGVFTWKVRRRGVKVGDVAGTKHSQGYWQIRINGKIYLAHRLAWLYIHGHIPKELDHINGVKADNRISNLRVTTSSQNQANKGKQSNNTSGYKGVSWNKRANKWQASIWKNGKQIYLGYFTCPIRAASAYDKAATDLFGEYAKLNFSEKKCS